MGIQGCLELPRCFLRGFLYSSYSTVKLKITAAETILLENVSFNSPASMCIESRSSLFLPLK